MDLYKYRSTISVTDNVKFYLFKSLKRKINRQYANKFIPTSNETFVLKNKSKKNYSQSHEANLIAEELQSEKTFKLSETLSFLSTKQRQGLQLRFMKNKEYEEIALQMNVSVQTSRTIIYRAIKILRKYIILLSFCLMRIFFFNQNKVSIEIQLLVCIN